MPTGVGAFVVRRNHGKRACPGKLPRRRSRRNQQERYPHRPHLRGGPGRGRPPSASTGCAGARRFRGSSRWRASIRSTRSSGRCATAVIGNEKGEHRFRTARASRCPKSWSQQATNIVVSKDLPRAGRGAERERSVKQLIGRVVNTITHWARKQKYFAQRRRARCRSAAELKHLLVYQKAAFNSPVWFNCGSERRRSARRASSTRCRTPWTRS